jgi:hypothetical protein
MTASAGLQAQPNGFADRASPVPTVTGNFFISLLQMFFQSRHCVRKLVRSAGRQMMSLEWFKAFSTKEGLMIDQHDITPVLEKIKKLLALSTSSNPHEAALATAKAQELLAQYNVELSQIQTSEPASSYEQTALSTGSRVWRRQLLGVIARHNFCDTVYDPEEKQTLLIGERHNSEVVQYLYTYLVRLLESMATEAYRQSTSHLPAITWKDSFYAGALRSINQRLREQQSQFAATSSECRSLVVVKSEELQEVVHRFHPNLRTGRAKAVVCCDGYYDGIKAGRTVALNQALS